VLPRFEIVHRARPVAVVGEERRTGFVAPFAAVEADLGTHDVAGRLACELVAPGGIRLTGWYDGGRRLAGLDVTDASGRTTHHRSRRHGRPETPPDTLALALTGSWLSVLTRSDGDWTVRGRVQLPPRVDLRRPELLTGLTADVTWSPREPDGATPVLTWRSGTFGQLGLRDVHLVTHADGSPVEIGGRLYLTMTHAGPGFADTAHCGVWSYDPAGHDLRPTATIYFRRGGLVLGDHATHLVRDGRRWLVATSTWGDFDRTSVAITLAETTDDVLSGEHVLDARELALPTDGLPGRRVGTWDPHLALIDEHWHVAFVTARKFFSFHPALARAREPGRLDGFELVAAATDRTGTEGTVLARIGDDWRLLASDGPDNPAPHREGYPVFDLSLRKVGALDAPYPTNIPWPSLVERPDGWLLLTFDGTAYGGELPGYGTHGDVIVMRTNAGPSASNSAAPPGEGQG
jgi:hypothetical protein